MLVMMRQDACVIGDDNSDGDGDGCILRLVFRMLSVVYIYNMMI